MATTWFPELAQGDTILDQVVNHRAGYATAMRAVEAAIWSQDVLEAEILELCRLRIAQLLESPVETSRAPDVTDLDPALVERLRQWPTASPFTERQRVCLGFAEQVVIDAQGVTDEQATQVIATIGEGGFLVLTYACGFFETTQRATILLSARSG